MRKKLKTKLWSIQAIMITSLALLVAFVGYWLNAEYNSEKQRLKKDLTTELRIARQEISDSIIMEQYLSPMLAELDSEFSSNPDSLPFLLKSAKTNGNITNIKIKTTNSSENWDSAITTKQIKSETVYLLSDDSGKSVNIDAATAKKFMTGIFTVIAKELVHDSLKKNMREDLLDDSARTKEYYASTLKAKGFHFNTIWNSDTPHTSAYLAIEMEDEQTVKVSGYTPYLLKKITPQALFSLLLITMTSLAFWLTLRSLRNQIRLSELKNGLISNMSHELKTPVSTVKVALEALDNFDVVNQPDKAREYIHMAMLETHRLELLVNKALNTSLMEQGKMTLAKQPLDVLAVTSDIVTALKLRLQQRGAQINLASSGYDFIVNADKLHLQGAIMNIIDNSLKYGNDNVVIDINVVAKDASIAIELADNGPGIPEQYLPQVFDKFFRVPEGDRHNVKGYGLGLSYVHQVMEMHNGAASVRNLSKRGCSFKLEFYKGR